ncbi:hypothetical protein GF406_16830 [candidate division KSB1 bacterium]|nr:hypothetical protein [candidate division KSB1 bacterium]
MNKNFGNKRPLDMAYTALNAAKVLSSMEKQGRKGTARELDILNDALHLFSKILSGSLVIEGKNSRLSPDSDSIAGLSYAISSFEQMGATHMGDLSKSIRGLNRDLQKTIENKQPVDKRKNQQLIEFLIHLSDAIAERIAHPTEHIEEHPLNSMVR